MYSRNDQFTPNGNFGQASNSRGFQHFQQPPIKKLVIPSKSNNNQVKQLGGVASSNDHQDPRFNFAGNFDGQNGGTGSRNFFTTTNNSSSTSSGPKYQPILYGTHEGNSSKSTLGLTAFPKLKHTNFQNSVASSGKTNIVPQNLEGAPKMYKSGESEKEKLCILMGTVERVIRYGKIFQNRFCYFQVIGSVVSIADGKVQFEKTMLLRDKKGPILQLIYYSNATHINIEDFHLGQNLRAVGRMVGANVMSAITIRAATDDELEILPRLCYISDYSVSALCGDGPMQSKP